MSRRATLLPVILIAAALAACGPTPASAPEPPPAPPAAPTATANAAPLAYIVAQHSPLLDAAAKTAISQDFNGAPLSGARAQHQVAAENVRCEATACTVRYAPDKEVALSGEDAAALFAALVQAGVQDGAVREIKAVQCTVDDAAAQDTPATGDQVAGFACTFQQP